jgi:uncharacterized Fe-S center protein
MNNMKNVVKMLNKKLETETKKFISVKVTIQNTEEYEVESCWCQETQEFCEKIAEEVKAFVRRVTNQD